MRDAMTTNPETYSFLGRVFTLVGDRYQCDRCRRTYDTIIQAAECDGPNHSQIRGAIERRTEPLVVQPEPERPRKRGGAKPKYATEQERTEARRESKRKYNDAHRNPTSKRWTDEKRAEWSRIMLEMHARLRNGAPKPTHEEKLARRREAYRRQREHKPKRTPKTHADILARKRASDKAWRDRIKATDPERYADQRAKQRARAKAWRARNRNTLDGAGATE